VARPTTCCCAATTDRCQGLGRQAEGEHARDCGAAANLSCRERIRTGDWSWVVVGVHELPETKDRPLTVRSQVVDNKVDDSSYADGILIALDSLPDKKDLGICARLMSWEESALYPLDRA
jgi:hypothetical protein